MSQIQLPDDTMHFHSFLQDAYISSIQDNSVQEAFLSEYIHPLLFLLSVQVILLYLSNRVRKSVFQDFFQLQCLPLLQQVFHMQKCLLHQVKPLLLLHIPLFQILKPLILQLKDCHLQLQVMLFHRIYKYHCLLNLNYKRGIHMRPFLLIHKVPFLLMILHLYFQFLILPLF